MNGKGGCCIAKYGGGGGEGIYGMSKVDRIMLKFRPIAPKPVATGSGSGGSATDNSDGYVKCGRSKRKYVKVNKNKNDNSKKRRRAEKLKVKAASSFSQAVVTLPLLPETPDRKENEQVTGFSDLLSSASKCDNSNNNKLAPAPVWLRFNDQEEVSVQTAVMKPAPPPPPRRLPEVVSYVTVESVSDTWVEWELLGCTDEEIMTKMEKDTCPGFITDGQDRVVWTNTAFRKIAGIGHVVDGDDIAVVLVRKDQRTRSPVTYPAFTCKVRVTFAAVKSHRKTGSPSSPALTLPCDGWRMERGTCAWRLDVKAALSLGVMNTIYPSPIHI